MKMKMNNLLLTLLAVSSIFLFPGCYNYWHHVEGNHDVVSETRSVPAFDRVINEGNFEVFVIQDSIYEVTVEAESNLIPLINTSVRGSALIVETHENLKNHDPMKVYVRTPKITELSLEGSGLINGQELVSNNMDINLSGSGNIDVGITANNVEASISGSGALHMSVSSDEVNATISGSGEMELWGNTNRGDLHISGSGVIQAYDLVQHDCYANISGSGSMYLQVIDYLEVTISGSGNVYYHGNPQVVTHISGSGNVIHP